VFTSDLIVPPVYDRIGIFGANGHADWILVEIEGKQGFLNFDGKEVETGTIVK
jgi:hypothetical protein